MSKVFRFGECVDGYEVGVLNEREVRASAGILFFFALIAFMNAWLTGNFQPTRIFVIAFLVDFTIRVLVNPMYSPSIVLGRFAVRSQVPEYVGATQKRFAWSIGLVLAIAMLFLVVINRVIGPINLIICSACLLLLFFETAFGICLACKVYNLFHKEKAALCPGGSCEVADRHEVQKIGAVQMLVVALFLVAMLAIAQSLPTDKPHIGATLDSATAVEGQPTGMAGGMAGNGDCKVPAWAIAIGHGDMWKLHHNCK